MLTTCPATFTWTERAPDPQHQTLLHRDGIDMSVTLAHDPDGNVIGYLHVAFTTATICDTVWADAAEWVVKTQGYGHQIQDRQDLWRALARHNQLPPGRTNRTATRDHHDPPEDTNELEAQLAEVAAKHQREYDRWCEWMSHPYVWFSRVHDGHSPGQGTTDWRRQGIAHAMYLYTADRLAETGRTLRGTDNPAPAAKALWDKLTREGHATRTTIAHPYSPTRTWTYPTLDRR